VFSATVKNDGVITADTVTIELAGGAATITLNNVGPGETSGGSDTPNFGGPPPAIGGTLLVTVSATFSDGSSQEFSTSVRARAA